MSALHIYHGKVKGMGNRLDVELQLQCIKRERGKGQGNEGRGGSGPLETALQPGHAGRVPPRHCDRSGKQRESSTVLPSIYPCKLILPHPFRSSQPINNSSTKLPVHYYTGTNWTMARVLCSSGGGGGGEVLSPNTGAQQG